MLMEQGGSHIRKYLVIFAVYSWVLTSLNIHNIIKNLIFFSQIYTGMDTEAKEKALLLNIFIIFHILCSLFTQST